MFIDDDGCWFFFDYWVFVFVFCGYNFFFNDFWIVFVFRNYCWIVIDNLRFICDYFWFIIDDVRFVSDNFWFVIDNFWFVSDYFCGWGMSFFINNIFIWRVSMFSDDFFVFICYDVVIWLIFVGYYFFIWMVFVINNGVGVFFIDKRWIVRFVIYLWVVDDMDL